MPVSFHDVHRQFRLEKQPHAQDFLPAGNPESFSRIDAGIEVLRTPEDRACPLNLPEPRQRERRHPSFLPVVRQQVPVPMIRQQVVRMQAVQGFAPVEGLVSRLGLIGEHVSVPGLIVGQRRVLLVAQNIQIPGHQVIADRRLMNDDFEIRVQENSSIGNRQSSMHSPATAFCAPSSPRW
jgi:hypothetical protein